MRSYVQFLCLGGERMYIDTHTKETIEASVCEYLGFTKDELKLFFDSAYYSQKPVEEEIRDFVIRLCWRLDWMRYNFIICHVDC